MDNKINIELKEKKKAYQRKYRILHPEYRKEYYQKNKPRILARIRDNQKKNPGGVVRQTQSWNGRNWSKHIWSTSKQNAKRRGIEFSIHWSDIIIPETCPIFGWKLTTQQGVGNLPTNASLDRIDPSKGYTKDNIWVISILANHMKWNASKSELIAFAKGVLKHYEQ